MSVSTETTLSSDNYQVWTVADEPSLDERPGYYGQRRPLIDFPKLGRCEIVSRVLTSSNQWQTEINDIFEILLDHCDILLTSGCSLHVHVSPSGGSYTIEHLRNIIKGVIYYDRALTAIMPAERKDNQWAESNVKAIKTWGDAVNLVPQNTWAPLFDTFDKQKMIPNLMLGICGNRYVGWNFSNVLGGCGTVEFRRPPGVRSSAEANHWIALALGYVANAILLQDWSAIKVTKTHPSTADLRNAITRGTQILGPGLNNALSSMADIDEPATRPSSAELARINQKKKDKADKRSLFAEKVWFLKYRNFKPWGLLANLMC
ncbi:hypothetical protein FQN50_001181 [Emmonsiellopsis sp. PD_5]|nr:hypothetical protein FQN50_001181 [Emmonsiellopsis sp. PD_5]